MGGNLTFTLRTYFGFSAFRPGQAEAIQSLLSGQHTFAIMPTGAGKSLIYQLTALHLSEPTVVISPLIALMKDQVDSLERRGISCTYINSSLPRNEQARRIKAMTAGNYRLVYIAPERLRSNSFMQALHQMKIGLLAIDEAHCISHWGHDFRPDYLHIAAASKEIGNPLIIALTATATPQVQDDVVRLLDLPSAKKIITGFNHPNLFFEVHYTLDVQAKFRAIRDLLANLHGGTAITYVGTRRDAEEVADFICTVCKTQADFYHAGLDSKRRDHIQNRFLAGKLPALFGVWAIAAC